MTDIIPMTQVDAVYAATVETLIDNGVFFIEGETVASEVVTSEMRLTIRSKIKDMLQAGTVRYSKPEKLSDDKYVKNYVNGLITNWFEQDPRLNAGVKAKPKPKSPGYKKDEQIKALYLLLDTQQDNPDNLPAIHAAIDARISELSSKASEGSTLESVQKEMAV